MIIAYLARWFIPSSPATTARIVSIFQARRDALLYAHGEGGGGGWLEILSFRRSIAFQIARRGSWLNSMGGLNGIPLEHREGPRRSVKGCISSATTLFVAGQSDYAEKFRYATILRGLYARVEIPFALNWIRSPLSQAADNFFFFFSSLLELNKYVVSRKGFAIACIYLGIVSTVFVRLLRICESIKKKTNWIYR